MKIYSPIASFIALLAKKSVLNFDNCIENGFVALCVNILTREIWRQTLHATMFSSSNIFASIKKTNSTYLHALKALFKCFLALKIKLMHNDYRVIHIKETHLKSKFLSRTGDRGGVLCQKSMLSWYESAVQAEQNAFYRTKKALFVLENEHFEFSEI